MVQYRMFKVWCKYTSNVQLYVEIFSGLHFYVRESERPIHKVEVVGLVRKIYRDPDRHFTVLTGERAATAKTYHHELNSISTL